MEVSGAGADADAALEFPGSALAGGGASRELQSLYRLTDRLYRAVTMEEVFDAGIEAILSTLSADRASILLFDEAGVMQFRAWNGLSDRYRTRLAGHTPWQCNEPAGEPIFVSDIETSGETRAVIEEVRREGVRALGFVPLAARGLTVGKFMIYHNRPHDFTGHERDLAVAIARQVGFAIERQRTEEARQHAMADLRASEERFRLMSEHAPVMIWMSDERGRCLHLNRMLRRIWSVPDGETAGFDWASTLHPEDAGRVGAEIGAAMAARRPAAVKGRYMCSDGSYHVFETDARPRISADGTFLGMIGVNVDVTERERADAQRELLLAELNHRVKNTLAIVQAIAHTTLKHDCPPGLLTKFESRLSVLARGHNVLTQRNWQGATLQHVVKDTLLGTQLAEGRIATSGPPVHLTPRQTLAFTLALHELKTNAVKYGALSSEAGRVALDWAQSAETGRLRVVWRETGGPPVEPPRHRGFGSFVIERALAQDLGGEVVMTYPAEGLTCVIEAPMPRGGEPE